MRSAGKWLFWLLVAAGLLAGATGMYQRLTLWLQPTRLNQIVPWGLWVAFYIYFIGLSAGSFLLSTLIYVGGLRQYERVGRTAVWTAFCSLAAGMLFILLDLGRMGRFWTVFVHRNFRSVLEWEIHLYVLYLVVLLAEVWFLCRRDLVGRIAGLLSLSSADTSPASARRDMVWVKVLGVIGLPIAIGVHGGTGAIFAVVKARPYWYTGLFPIVFLVSALASGGGLLVFLTAFFSRRRPDATLVRGLGRLAVGILAVDLLLLASEVLVGLYGAVPDHLEAFRLIMYGPFAWVFWALQLLVGALVPIAVMATPALNRSPAWVGIAGLAIVVGIFGVRLNIVIPPLAFPLLPGLNTAISHARMNPFYVPSGMEWLSSLFVLALAAAVFAIGREVLPLDEQEEAAPAAPSRAEAPGDAAVRPMA